MKSRLALCLIALCVLFSLAAVSAEDNQTEIISDSADYHPFSELNQSISESTNEINLEHDYTCDNSTIRVNKENKFVINGNGHIIDGAVASRHFVFKSDDVVIINNLTFQNFADSSLKMYTPVIFSNVKFINCTSLNYTTFISSSADIQFDRCIFEDNTFV